MFESRSSFTLITMLSARNAHCTGILPKATLLFRFAICTDLNSHLAKIVVNSKRDSMNQIHEVSGKFHTDTQIQPKNEQEKELKGDSINFNRSIPLICNHWCSLLNKKNRTIRYFFYIRIIIIYMCCARKRKMAPQQIFEHVKEFPLNFDYSQNHIHTQYSYMHFEMALNR